MASDAENTETVLIDLVTGYWNLVAVLSEQAMLAGVAPDAVAHAVKTLAQRNQKGMSREAGETVNSGVWSLYEKMRGFD